MTLPELYRSSEEWVHSSLEKEHSIKRLLLLLLKIIC